MPNNFLPTNFLSADVLGLTAKQHFGLVKTLELLESGKVKHYRERRDESFIEPDQFPHSPFYDLDEYRFNMGTWVSTVESVHCGTVACLGGTACLIMQDRDLFDKTFDTENRQSMILHDLFYPAQHMSYNNILPTEAAVQLRKYLETGTHDWMRRI